MRGIYKLGEIPNPKGDNDKNVMFYYYPPTKRITIESGELFASEAFKNASEMRAFLQQYRNVVLWSSPEVPNLIEEYIMTSERGEKLKNTELVKRVKDTMEIAPKEHMTKRALESKELEHVWFKEFSTVLWWGTRGAIIIIIIALVILGSILMYQAATGQL